MPPPRSPYALPFLTLSRALKRFLEDELATAIKESYDAAFGGDDALSDVRRRATRDALRKIEW